MAVKPDIWNQFYIETVYIPESRIFLTKLCKLKILFLTQIHKDNRGKMFPDLYLKFENNECFFGNQTCRH